MMKTNLRRLLVFAATAGLAGPLAACGQHNAQQSQAPASPAAPPAMQPGWSMNDLAAVDPAYLDSKAAPLPQAVPMKASYSGHYAYAPSYDYGPQPYDGYYTGSAGPDDYQWLALASSLGGMLGDAPPDYAFSYDGVQPWAWETGDRYLRYAEPIDGGYRYYYYEPDSERPFLISDPYYSYGYRGDRLVTIYDRSGRLIDADRAARERRAAQNYFARAQQMYAAAHRERRLAVAASLWDRHRTEVAAQQRQWNQARRQRLAWQRWDAQNEQRLHRDWASEALVRREAERRFAGWQKADFKTPAPRFYSPQQRQAQLQKVAAIRQSPRFAAQQRARQNERQRRLAALQRHAQQQRVGQQPQQVTQQLARQKAVQQAHAARRQTAIRQQQVQKAAQQRVAQTQRVKAQQAQKVAVQQRHAQQQAQQRAQHATQQKQQAARQVQHRRQAEHAAQQRRQQASRQAAQHLQQAQAAARARQQQAQRAAQQRRTQQAAQQRQARPAQKQRQAKVQHAAQQRQTQARKAAQHEAQQARAAQQPRGKNRKDNGHGRGQS